MRALIDAAAGYKINTLHPSEDQGFRLAIDGFPLLTAVGVEGALWAETLQNVDQAERLMFPRLIALAEIGWSPAADRAGDDDGYKAFVARVAAQGPRLTAQGIDYHTTPEVPWN